MTFNDHILGKVNDLRALIQHDPTLPTVDHGESVAIALWYTFLLDHSRSTGMPVKRLAREQLAAFLGKADQIVRMYQAPINQ